MQDVNKVVSDYSGRSRIILDYSLLVKQIVDSAGEPGFSTASWAPLAALVDTASFQRVGNFKEVLSWDEYIGFLTQWAPTAQWECSFKRITEQGDLVFLELEERSVMGEFRSVVNSLSVYEFDEADKIKHIDIYLQMEPLSAEMLKSYEGVI